MKDPIDALFTLPPGEFTAARDRLAAQLATEKEPARARDVKALRRPTVAAWVVNQLAHRHGASIRRLIDAGAALRRAQQSLIRGRGAGDLRAATKHRQQVLAELRRLAGPILQEAGAKGHLDDVLATLETASVDPRAAAMVTAGRLSRELPRPSGFGETGSPSLTVVRPREVAAAKAPPGTRPTRAQAAEAERLEREAARGAQALARATQRTATLERARREHEKRVEGLRADLADAERRLRDADSSLDRARAEESRASARASELRRAAEAARSRQKS